jgi:glycosyltransferase involved in cell wall biosynthesis
MTGSNCSASQVTVLLPVFNGYESVRSCLESLLHDGLDPAISSLIIIDDASSDGRIQPLLDEFAQQDILKLKVRRNPVNLGYLHSVNSCLHTISGPVILLNSDTIVSPGWATRMVTGAKRYPRLGMLTPLSNNATFSTLGDPSFLGRTILIDDLPRMQELCASRKGCEYPLAPTGMGFCLFITELARSIVADFDELFAPGYEEENDMAQKLRAHGLQCRIATDVYIYHKGGESFASDKLRLQHEHFRRIQEKHPCYSASVSEWFSHLDYPWDLIGSNDRKCIHILLDCEVMRQSMTGVVRYLTTILDGFDTLASSGQVQVTALVTDRDTKAYWQPRYPWVNWRLDSEVAQESIYPEFDIYHIVNANLSLDRLLAFRRRACRLVMTLHDLIAFENPGYFESGIEYISYRQRLHLMVNISDHILAISKQTQIDAIEQLFVPAERCELFPNPLKHLWINPQSPQEIREESNPYCLVVGTDFYHKNILLTVKIFRDIVHTLNPNMRLVIAGPEVDKGGSSAQLDALLQEDHVLAGLVDRLGPVSDADLIRLYQGAFLCFYLSLHEGFGYIPYEACMHGCPTLVANTSVFSDCPVGIAISPYPCGETEAAIANVLLNPSTRQQNLDFWKNRVATDQSRHPGSELAAIYAKVLAKPRPPAGGLLAELLSSSIDGVNPVLGQSDLKRAIRSVSKRILLAARRKVRFRIKRWIRP